MTLIEFEDLPPPKTAAADGWAGKKSECVLVGHLTALLGE